MLLLCTAIILFQIVSIAGEAACQPKPDSITQVRLAPLCSLAPLLAGRVSCRTACGDIAPAVLSAGSLRENAMNVCRGTLVKSPVCTHKCEEQHVSGGTGQYDVRLLIMDRALCLHGHVLCLNPECVSQIGLPKNLRDAAAWGVA